jgi:predicted nuclease of restriction endonuclease-like RecB superfamily
MGASKSQHAYHVTQINEEKIIELELERAYLTKKKRVVFHDDIVDFYGRNKIIIILKQWSPKNLKWKKWDIKGGTITVYLTT